MKLFDIAFNMVYAMVSPINGKSVERIQKLLQIEYSKKAAKYINGLDIYIIIFQMGK